MFELITILFIAAATASLTNFLDDCFQKGMIFEFYGNWIFKEDHLNKDITDKIDVLKCELNDTIREDEKAEISTQILMLDAQMTPTPKWKKPIGNCMICTNVWCGFLMLILFMNVPVLFNILSIIGISNTALKFIIK